MVRKAECDVLAPGDRGLQEDLPVEVCSARKVRGRKRRGQRVRCRNVQAWRVRLLDHVTVAGVMVFRSEWLAFIQDNPQRGSVCHEDVWKAMLLRLGLSPEATAVALEKLISPALLSVEGQAKLMRQLGVSPGNLLLFRRFLTKYGMKFIPDGSPRNYMLDVTE